MSSIIFITVRKNIDALTYIYFYRVISKLVTLNFLINQFSTNNQLDVIFRFSPSPKKKKAR